MSDKHAHVQNDPSREDIRSAKKGWTVVVMTVAAMFGAAYVMAEI